MAIFFSSMATLFQPVIKISLGRTLWNVVDVVMAIVLLVICIGNIGINDYLCAQDEKRNHHHLNISGETIESESQSAFY